MAGDWIKMRTTLGAEQATMAICDRTGLDEFAVVGRLHAVWVWAGEHTTTGIVRGVTLKTINRIARCESFAEAMIAADWLKIIPSESENEEILGVIFTRWKKWNDKSAKRRHLAAIRSARHREKSSRSARDGARDATRKKRGPRDARDATRVEESREEKNAAAPATPPPQNGEPAAASGQRQQLQQRIFSLGVDQAVKAMETAVANGCSLDEIDAACTAWTKTEVPSTWLYQKLTQMLPGEPPDRRFPPVTAASPKQAKAKLEEQKRQSENDSLARPIILAGRREQLSDADIGERLAAAGLEWPK